MTVEQRTPYKFKHPGPYLAIVKNHLDPGYMGGLEVALIKKYVDNTDMVASQSLKVKYLSPFYGVTPIDESKKNDRHSFDETQKSYGMWMVPPDVGTTVMVIFVGGSSNEGYWIGCVQDKFMNHMIPGIANNVEAMAETEFTDGQLYDFGKDVKNVPVAEFNKKSNDTTHIVRPVHPFANRLAEQGLLTDTIRGATSSSARREIPSMVFGISTPGPLDKTNPNAKGTFNYDGKKSGLTPISRLGGSTFVMDDGDENGDNELVRIRTRTGHQVLLHNTKDLIYIANASGTAWIELTSNGKIDIFAQDSVSIHTEQDFNFRADRDVNLEAGRNINIKAGQDITTNAKDNFSINAGLTTTITSTGQLYVNSAGKINILSNTSILATAVESVEVLSNSDIMITALKTVNIYGEKVTTLAKDSVDTASAKINNTGIVVTNTPSPTLPNGKFSEVADTAIAPVLTTYNVPRTSETVGWGDNKYNAGNLTTIMQRVPMHEPWSQHEDLSSELFSPENTDVSSPYVNPPSDVAGNADLITFTARSGDEAHFLQTKSELQAAVLKAAQLYKDSGSGRRLTITSSYRSEAEQRVLFNRWKEAGGNVNTKPKAAGLYVPVDPSDPKKWPNAHNLGIGFDSPDASDLDRRGILAKAGLFRPSPTIDPVHVQLKTTLGKI